MPDSEIDRKIDELEKAFDERVDEAKESDGFLTSKGKLFSRAEWHATILGISPIGLAYLLPTPMGELFILMQLGYLRTGVKKWGRNEPLEGHLGDVTEEVAYTITFAFLTVIFFHFTGLGEITSIDVTQIVLAMIGGA